MRAIILAGGLGSRLREKVPNLPKPMAPVGGRPFLEYVLDWLIYCGVSDVVLSVGYRAEEIENHFGSAYRGLIISYSREHKPLGTGGAIKRAMRSSEVPCLVVNGDTLIKADLRAFIAWYEKNPSCLAMVLKKMDDVFRYGAVDLVGDTVTGFHEKGSKGAGYINAGVYIVNASLFAEYSFDENFSFEADLVQAYVNSLRPKAFLTNEYFIDIGIPDDYERAQCELSELRCDESGV